MGDAADRELSWQEFLELWERLLEDSGDPGTVVVVEGEHDREALRRLGVDGRIVPLHHGRRLPRVARDLAVSARRVIILTDWDTEGGHFARKLGELLAADDVDVDLDLRKRLARALRSELTHLEGLYGWARRNAERRGAPLEHFHPLGRLADGLAPRVRE
jgi:5S rRNA maturation endonuclease (ribonuclease M5)